MAKYKRRIKLIKPRLQLRLTLVFVGFATLSLLMQSILFAAGLTRAALDLPTDSTIMVESSASLLWRTLWTSLVLFLPLTFAVGILTTFRFAGPIYRFEVFLNEVLRGEKPADCKIRRGDEMQEFCELLNKVTQPLRERESAVLPPAATSPETAGPPSLAERMEESAEAQSRKHEPARELGEAG